MVNTDYFQDTDYFDYFQDDDVDNEAPYRTFGLGQAGRERTRVSIRREHR